MGWREGLISWLRRGLVVEDSPRRGRRAYEGASRGRRSAGWITSNTGANAEVGAAASTLRQRSRDLIRNNPHAAKAKEVFVNNVVGTGIRPRSAIRLPVPPGADEQTRNEIEQREREANQRVDDLFARWVDECESSGQYDYYGMQAMAAGALFESGEVIARRRRRRAADGLVVPVQIQLLEADHLDLTKSKTLSAGRIVQGVEYGVTGSRVAYWLHASHPGETIGALQSYSAQSQRVPAEMVVHLYSAGRPGQARGVPALAPVMNALHDNQDYTEAEIVRKKLEACTVAFVFGDEDDQLSIAPTETDANADDGQELEHFEPGLIARVRGGKDVKFNSPASIGGYAEYQRTQLHAIAAGLGMTYELLSGDLSQVNYSSIRAGLIEFRRSIRMMQQHVFIRQFCRRSWQWFTESAIVAGELAPGDYPVVWAPPRFEEVDRQKDAAADLAELRAGTASLRSVLSAKGLNPDDVLREIAETAHLLDELGLVLDSDPRHKYRGGAETEPVDTQEPPG